MIKNIREIIQREKNYVWMVIFILSLNAFSIASGALSSKGLIKTKEKSKTEEASPTYQRLTNLKQADLKSTLEKNLTLAKWLGFLGLLTILVIAMGLILDFKFISLKLEGKNILPSVKLPLRTKWRIADILRVIILFLFFGYLVSLAQSMVFNFVSPRGFFDKNLYIVINTSIMDVLALLFIFYFVTKKYKQKLSAIGLSFKNLSSHILLGIGSYITIVPVILAVLFIIIWLCDIFNYQPPSQPIFDLFFEEKSQPLVMYLSIFVTIIGPIVEEIFFRGFAYRALRRRLGVFNAIILTSLVFAVLHTNLAGFLPILILGILLAYLTEKTNSLIPSITVHVMHNTAILSFLLLTKKILETA